MSRGDMEDVVFSAGILRATKTIEKVEADQYAVHSFTEGWITAYLNEKECVDYVEGRLSPLDLEWE